MSLLDAMPGSTKRGMAQKLLTSEMGNALLDIVARAEHQLVESVVDLQRAADLADEERIERVIPPEDRREQLRSLALAKLEGRFPEWWVVNCSGVDNAEEATEKVGVDWEAQKARWADLVRENGAEGDDVVLAESYCQRRYGCSLKQFRHLVVEWPEGDDGGEPREAREMRAVAVGGLSQAKETIDAVTAELDGGNDE
ncbi:hypothetical protein [Halorubellus litoreus]|uniref:Uncharacterized protein n=1 Tax=Halorubellus litoreus TaxID=755308 RepID=A0ABD5VGB3_9EURY